MGCAGERERANVQGGERESQEREKKERGNA